MILYMALQTTTKKLNIDNMVGPKSTTITMKIMKRILTGFGTILSKIVFDLMIMFSKFIF